MRPQRRSQSPARKIVDEAPPDFPQWLDGVRSAVENEAPLMQALIIRAVNAVLRFTELTERSAVNATAAPTDLALLLRALSSGELLEDLTSVEPLAPAFIRGIEAKRRLLEEHGGVLSAGQAGSVLGLTRQAVEKRRQAGRLIALHTGRHGYRYPAWQFTASGVLPGLETVLGALADHDEWMQTIFFVSRNPRLGNRTPIEMLSSQKLDRVLKAAEMYGEHGAA